MVEGKTQGKNTEDATVWILYGSHTGNGERLAGATRKRLIAEGMVVNCCDMAFFDPMQLLKINRLLVIVSTHGIGEPPAAAAELYDTMMAEKDMDLSHLRYAVLALGDTGYAQFCQTGKDFDEAFARLGAARLLKRVDLDVDFEEGYLAWVGKLEGWLGNDGMTE